ncbi:symplekin [Elysia marginata]|uniref:Symplekin n=1 Tax=Elysia marginata TaxID=1093978 RepID=A0AAV4IR77_9GAST|nr:symplekin [Elysia marginata]
MDRSNDRSSPTPGPSSKTNIRRSTAAQFFNKDEEADKATDLGSTYDTVVTLLNDAAVMSKSAEKIASLRKAQELIIHKSSDLLDNFLDEMLAFQSDQSKDVKRFIIGFMEEACKKDFECLPKVMPSMVMLLGDDDINVQKKVILTVSSMFRLTLAWISKTKQTRTEMKEVWMHLNEVKNLMYDFLESVNDGIRTHAVKFLEGLTLTLSKRTQDSYFYVLLPLVNLPPTLAKSQVSSVRKNLKTQMMGLLKHSASLDFLPQISTLLTDLGASQSEIDEDDDGLTPWVDRTSKKSKPEPAQKQTAIDVTAEDILPRLNPQNVTDLVLLSMVMLPDSMPALFESTYTPVAAAGTQAQISHIARLLATQLTMAGMGKGLGELQMQALKSEAEAEGNKDDEQPASPKQIIQTVVGLKTDEQEQQPPSKKLKMSQLPMPPGVRKIKQFQLSHATKPLKEKEVETMATLALERILKAENLLEFIFSDLRSRQDLVFAWLYQEYANCQGYSTAAPGGRSSLQGAVAGSYSNCLTNVLAQLFEMDDHHADMLFHRVLLEAPLLTDNAIIIVRKYCNVPEHTEAGMKTLSQLINNRPAHRHRFLEIMLEFTAHEKQEIRDLAIKAAKALHMNGKMQEEIEKYANQQLKKLLQPKPPTPLGAKLEDMPEAWTEETIKAHLYLHLGLLPSNHKLIHELANVYTATNADIKRAILRVLESPVKGMGMDSPELLTLVENCPKGSETLVMRVIHILTDKAVPSPQLVERIRDLYHKRVPDVRFLIPVLNGLSKAEVMEALPKLIKLNPMVVKEVFNRLMGSHVHGDSMYQSPLTPVELLVALHNIDPNKCDIKTTIKAANLCFAEKATYTQEVLAIVMQQLMEQDPLPTLLMRTVIQSMSMYPRLTGFVLNILQRLIVKKVWKQKKVWEGFIRCCQRAKPQSFQVLLQLPVSQLKDVFENCPDLKEPLLEHVQTFTENQKAHVNKSVMTFLEELPEKDNEKIDIDSQVEQQEKTPGPEPEVTCLGNSVENNAVSNLTAVKTVDSSFSSNSEKTKSGGMKTSARAGSRDIQDRENSGEKEQGSDRENTYEKERGSKDREESKDRDRMREKGASQERDRGRDRAGSRERDRGKDKDGERDRTREKEVEREAKERVRGRDRDVEKEREREGEAIREREREKTQDRGRDRDIDRERGRDKEVDKERSREKDRTRERSKERDRVRERGRSRDRSKERDRGRERAKSKDREKERGKEKGSSRDVDKEKDRSYDKERDRDEEKKRKDESLRPETMLEKITIKKEVEDTVPKESNAKGEEEKTPKSATAQTSRRPSSSSSKKK